MVDLSKTIAAKSDQLNADDLIGGPITVKITNVGAVTGDQPIAISYEGDNGKPWKPCKTMRRLLVQCWGKDGSKYIGRSMTLFRDATVRFGGQEVGGIRVSHLSDIPAALTFSLTAARASKKPYRVEPLSVKSQKSDESSIKLAREAAAKGSESFRIFWKEAPPAIREAIKGKMDEIKEIAASADAMLQASEEISHEESL